MDKQYIDQANKFLADTKTTLVIVKSAIQSPPDWDKTGSQAHKHIKYDVELSNANGKYFFNFWGSVAEWENVHYSNGKYRKPTAYDILAGMSGYEPDTDYYEWCKDYGFEPSHETERIHKAVLAEYRAISKLFTQDQLIQLDEIQ